MKRFSHWSSVLSPALASLLFLGCGGSDEGSSSSPSAGGSSQAGKGGASQAGAGSGGGLGGGAGQGGGSSGQSGEGGSAQAGSAGAQAGEAGASGEGGSAPAGAGGSDAGAGGSDAGAGGSAGEGGSGVAGQGGSIAAGTGGTGGDAGQGGASGASGQGGGTSCPTGDLCEGGICAGGACCKASLACNDACCQQGQLCSFGACVNPGQSCFDSSDCAGNEYCERGGSEPGSGGQGGQCSGGSGAAGVCLPLPPICAEGESGVGPNGQITCLQKCEVKPDTIDFVPELKYSWGGKTVSPFESDVMMAPIVIQLDDDDCDGKITERDIPEIVFTTFTGAQYNALGTVHAISVVGGQVVEKWATPGLIRSSSELAAGNFDGNPGNEIVGCDTGGFVQAISGDGKPLWKSNVAAAGCRMPSIADVDGDGQPEVLAGNSVFDGTTGVQKAQLAVNTTDPVALDLDGNGSVELVAPGIVFDGQGQILANSGLAARWQAVGDLDNDGNPEIVAVDFATHQLHVWRYEPGNSPNFKVIRQGININGTLNPNLCASGSAGNTKGGGPPTIADFNGDGTPDIALAGGVGYAVFDGKKIMDTSVPKADTFLWVKQTQDCSSASTGSSLFDFNGDGKAEVLYADEKQFRIYQGDTGNILFETCNTSGTLLEYPIVADVDNDGQADIIVASNAYSSFNCGGTKTAGIRIFGSKSGGWVRTRRVWNQHPYHITNINEDGSVPAVEPLNWKQPGLNNFRINKQPGLEFAAPDVVVEVRPDCAKGNQVAMIVRNLGQSVLPPGVVVDLLKGSAPNGQLINEQFTTQTLFPAQSEILFAIIDDPDVLDGVAKVYGVVSFTSNIKECRTDNNTSPEVFGACTKF